MFKEKQMYEEKLFLSLPLILAPRRNDLQFDLHPFGCSVPVRYTDTQTHAVLFCVV